MYMIYWNNGDFAWPYGNDPECAGAVQVDESAPVLFDTRKAAQTAIRISTAHAQLRRAQGLPVNVDFLEDRHCLKIVRIVPYQAPQR